MSKNIKYRITFHSDWHCGSGLAAGADVDALVIKDNDGMPFVPGKTIKGLVREAIDIVWSEKEKNISIYNQVFGREGEVRSESFFRNAVMLDDERTYILSVDAAQYMYRSIASTAIDGDGIADDNNLRKIQVTVPCALTGEILNVHDEMVEPVIQALKYIKRLGQWRNRGLGRCTIDVTDPQTTKDEKGGGL